MSKELFNENQKKIFMFEQNGTSSYLYQKAFERISDKEKEYNKDVCMMTREELVDTLKVFGSRSNITPVISRLRKYTLWAKERGLIKTNYLDKKITPTKELTKMIGDTDPRYYISEEKYNEYKQTLRSTENGIYLTAILCCCYEGIIGNNFENIANLRVRDIPDGNIITLYDGEKRHISDELKCLLIEASCVDIMYGDNNRNLIYGKYADSIFKTSKETNNHKRKFMTAFNNPRRIKDLLKDEELTAEVLYRSGLFNFVRDKCKMLGYPFKEDFTDVISTPRSEVGILMSSGIVEKYNAVLDDYGTTIRWYQFKKLFADWVEYI